MLMEEIFDFSEEDMLSTKVTKLKASLQGEFGKVFELCQFALEKSQRASLITATLTTASRFMSWVPLPYVFETPVLSLLVTRFLHLPQFRCDVLTVVSLYTFFKKNISSFQKNQNFKISKFEI